MSNKGQLVQVYFEGKTWSESTVTANVAYTRYALYGSWNENLNPYNVKSGCSQPRQACWPPGSCVNKRSSALQAGGRYLPDISTGARNLVRAVCTFLLWRKVRGFGLKSPRFISIVSFSTMWYSAAIVAIKSCNSLRACFLTSMEQKRFFKCNIYFNEHSLFNFLWIRKWGEFHPLRCGFPIYQKQHQVKVRSNFISTQTTE